MFRLAYRQAEGLTGSIVGLIVAQHHPDAAVGVPPRANALPSDTAETAHALNRMLELGRPTYVCIA